MGVRVETRGALPNRAWDVQASRELGQLARTVIVSRAFRQGLGSTDAPHKPYSTNPMTVTAGSPLDQRLKAKGGTPAYGRGRPRRLLNAKGRASRSLGWVITGRHYERGYAQYKAESRKGRGGANPTGVPKLPTSPSGGTAAVDLTLSGQMQRDFRVKDVSLTRVEIGLTATLDYGPHVQAARPWMALSPNDKKIIDKALGDPTPGPDGAPLGIVGRAMARSVERQARQAQR